jgi:hypothetical protein
VQQRDHGILLGGEPGGDLGFGGHAHGPANVKDPA